MSLVIRKNLYRSPMFSEYSVSDEATTNVETKDGVLTVTGTDLTKSYAGLNIDGLTPGMRLVFRCRVEPLADLNASTQIIWIYRKDWGSCAGFALPDIVDGVVSKEFTVPSDGYVGVRFCAGSKEGTRYSEPLIEDASTLDESLPFFYYGTMPDPRSA